MKQVINALIGLGLLVLGMCSILLAFYIIAILFTGEWYVAAPGRGVAGFIGLFFGVYLICAYFDAK